MKSLLGNEMKIKAQRSFFSSRHATALLGSAVLIGLSLTSLYSYLLFHSLAELFSIVAALPLPPARNSPASMPNSTLRIAIENLLENAWKFKG